MVEMERIELSIPACKTGVFPLALHPLSGSEGGIRTHGWAALQAVALDRSATSLCLASREGLEPPQTVLETVVLPLHHREISG
jgi:hypothetical protein